MSYMGYYFYPDAVESIKGDPHGGKKDRAGWLKPLLVLGSVTALALLISFLVAL
jgi:hypothetical protein